MCVEDLVVLFIFVACLGSVDGLGSLARAWV